MKEFNFIADCDICNKRNTLCKEVTLFTKEKKKEVAMWCVKCSQEIDEEMARQQEEALYEVYEDIIRSSY